MSIRIVYACLFVLTAGWLVPGALVGQDTPTQDLGDSLALAFEREVFTYPEYARRNPFKTLLAADGGGPRFESLLLLGILYSPFAGESIALFGEGTRSVDSGNAGAPETVTVELTGGTYRVREGATLGNPYGPFNRAPTSDHRVGGIRYHGIQNFAFTTRDFGPGRP